MGLRDGEREEGVRERKESRAVEHERWMTPKGKSFWE